MELVTIRSTRSMTECSRGRRFRGQNLPDCLAAMARALPFAPPISAVERRSSPLPPQIDIRADVFPDDRGGRGPKRPGALADSSFSGRLRARSRGRVVTRNVCENTTSANVDYARVCVQPPRTRFGEAPAARIVVAVAIIVETADSVILAASERDRVSTGAGGASPVGNAAPSSYVISPPAQPTLSGC
jgi:hypothetical protein